MRSVQPTIDDLHLPLGGVRHRVRRIVVAATWDRPWLVFLHEGLGSIEQWRSFPRHLAVATSANALVYDRRGHGGSGPLPGPRGTDYHAEEAELLAALVRHLDIPSVVSYGHSDGGTIALLHAAAHPGQSAALVVEAGHVIGEDVARMGIRAAQDAFASGGLRAALSRYHGDRVDAMFSAWADTWLSEPFRDWSVVDRLATVTAPTLVLQGADDHYATPAHVDWIANAVGGIAETWLLPGIGHAPHHEATDLVIERVARFLRDHGADTSSR